MKEEEEEEEEEEGSSAQTAPMAPVLLLCLAWPLLCSPNGWDPSAQLFFMLQFQGTEQFFALTAKRINEHRKKGCARTRPTSI